MKNKQFEQILTKLIEEAKGLENEDYIKEEIMKAAVKAMNEIISDKKEELKAILNTWVRDFPESKEEMQKEFPDFFDSDNTNTYMTGIEAIKAAWNGKKVRRAIWGVTKPEISYIALAEKNRAIVQYDRCGKSCGLYVFPDEYERTATDWYIVE